MSTDNNKVWETNDSVKDADVPAGKCPFMHGGGVSHTPHQGTVANQRWWPNQLNLKMLHQNGTELNPYGDDFDYRKEFLTVDLEVLKSEINELMTTSQDWWPADYGHYGPFFIRMAWHAAGTYRSTDGRGGSGKGNLRFAPLNSWPDNGNLDKARKLLWPIKQKYGRKLSWGDLMILTGNCAIESMGLKPWGFAGGREDLWEPEEDIYWGKEAEWMGDDRHSGDRELEQPLAATHMGLIYVNPEGPNGNPDPIAAAKDIRNTFGRMAMNDEEIVALIAGGHTFGKAHGAADPEKFVGAEPEGAPLEQMGLGWKNSFGKGHSEDTITSGLEGAWTTAPTQWDNEYFENLFGYEWKLTKSPAGAHQWIPTDRNSDGTVPDAHREGVKWAPIMFTTDLTLRMDPKFEKISRRFLENPDEFGTAFAKAWHKLTHRDMGPYERGLGSLLPAEPEIWQDPIPACDHPVIDADDIASLKSKLLGSELSISQLVSTAWASAATFRGSDMRGGANGARLRLSPQRYWECNQPTELDTVLPVLEQIQSDFNASAPDGKKVSLADLIVLGGCAAVEKAAADAGHAHEVPFTPGRMDATAEQTDVESFAELEPEADGFRNYLSRRARRSPEELIVDRAQLLTLTAPEMTVLVGGLRVLDTNVGKTRHGVFTDTPGQLTTDFFRTLLSMDLEWKATDESGFEFSSTDLNTGDSKWMATRADLVFGSNSQLKAISEVYACADGEQKFVSDFIAAWDKVMTLDRFDLHA